MKKNLFRYLTALLAVIMILGVIPVYTATAANNVKIKPVDVRMNFDGMELRPPAGQFVFIYKGTTYVPLRFVSYAVRKNVNWNGKESKVTITDPTPAQLISIKEKMINASSTKNTSSTDYKLLAPMQVNYVFNGESKSLPKGQLSLMYKGTLYVPIRFVSESAGVSIKWDATTKTVKGVSQIYTENPTDGSWTSDGNGTNTQTKPTPPETPATGSPGTGGSGSGENKMSYESITSNTESKLQSLQAESKSTLLNLAKQYLSSSDESTKQKLLEQGQQQLNSLTARFESIVGAAESELKANGYSTEIINQYRKAFQDEIEAGKQLAEGLAG